VRLIDYQRAFVQASFTEEVADQSFEALGDAGRIRLYRSMIRARLSGMAQQAFKVSRAFAGDSVFEASFERYLEAHPPRSPFIRDVVADFGPFAAAHAAITMPEKPWLQELYRFEEAKWRVAYKEAHWQTKVGDFDFSGAPVLNETLLQMQLEYPVQSWVAPEQNGAFCAPECTRLLIYRPPGADDIRWYAADPLIFGVLHQACATPECSLADLVRATAAQLGKELNEALLEDLATGVTVALQRSVILGSREPA
jgi:hypothetical protein